MNADDKKQNEKLKWRNGETTKKPIRHFRDLDVYQNGFETGLRVYKSSKKFPDDERYALTDQVRRSSRSVCANIAEAWRKRRYQAAFASKLSDAEAEAAETEVWLDFALRCGFLRASEHTTLRDNYDHICRQLSLMIGDAASWCASDHRVREEQADYFVRSPEPPL